MTNCTNEINIAMLPDVGSDDWGFAFQAAIVRSMETSLLSGVLLQDMAAANGLSEAVEMLSGTDYAISSSKISLPEIEKTLIEARSELAGFFADLLAQSPVAILPAMLVDISNARLAVRRFVSEQPIGDDYSPDGSEPPSNYETVFEQDDYTFLPNHLQEAIEQGTLAYYKNKDIRDIDYAIDQVQIDAVIRLAQEAKCPFLAGLTRVGADLTNIKTVMRKTLMGRDTIAGFLEGGFVEIDKLKAAVMGELEQFSSICFATPYGAIIDEGLEYLGKQNSFLKLEALCDGYFDDCLNLAGQITAGIQPAIAYYYKKADQIRKVRMILTAKSNMLEKQLILDRLGV